MDRYGGDVIEPSGTPISLPPNRQTKVPGMGSDQRASVQSIADGAPNDQAQDDKGYGSLSTAGIGENVPANGYVESCSIPAQDSDSAASGFSAPLTPLNVGASGEGMSAVSIADSISANGSKSVDGNTTPSGRTITGSSAGTKDIGVQVKSILPGFPSGAHE